MIYLFILFRFRFYRFVCVLVKLHHFLSRHKYSINKLLPPVGLNFTCTLRLIMKKTTTTNLYLYNVALWQPTLFHYALLCFCCYHGAHHALFWGPCRASITNNDCSVMDYTESPIRSSLSVCHLKDPL